MHRRTGRSEATAKARPRAVAEDGRAEDGHGRRRMQHHPRDPDTAPRRNRSAPEPVPCSILRRSTTHTSASCNRMRRPKPTSAPAATATSCPASDIWSPSRPTNPICGGTGIGDAGTIVTPASERQGSKAAFANPNVAAGVDIDDVESDLGGKRGVRCLTRAITISAAGRQPRRRQPPDSTLLLPSDGGEPGAVATARSGLDLHEDHGGGAADNEVEFAVFTTPVTVEDAIPGLGVPTGRGVLAPAAQLLIVRSHSW